MNVSVRGREVVVRRAGTTSPKPGTWAAVSVRVSASQVSKGAWWYATMERSLGFC